MGSIKEQMYSSSGLKVSFKCPDPECDCTIEDHVEDTDFDWTQDQTSDGISTAQSHVECPECREVFTVEVVAKGGEKDVIVHDHPETVVRFHDNTFDHDFDYDQFLAEYEPYEPYEVYQQSLRELGDLDSSSKISGENKPTFAKMIYLQYVVILEAYLSDRLIDIIANDEKKLLALVGSCAALRDRTPKLIEMAKDPDLVVKTAKTYLQNFSFHNVTAVAPFYKAVLGVELFSSEANKAELVSVIERRHHLVHRNGRDANGKIVPINDMHVLRVRRLVDNLVGRVEEAYVAYRSARRADDDLGDIPF